MPSYSGKIGAGSWKRQTNSGDGNLRGLPNGALKMPNRKQRYSRVESRAAPACVGQESFETRETQLEEQLNVTLL